jgi:hypothetical protein
VFSTGALRTHNASNGEINAHTTSKVEKRTAKDPRDTGDRMRISIFLFGAGHTHEFKAPANYSRPTGKIMLDLVE